jgi:hypothetical protein
MMNKSVLLGAESDVKRERSVWRASVEFLLREYTRDTFLIISFESSLRSYGSNLP